MIKYSKTYGATALLRTVFLCTMFLCFVGILPCYAIDHTVATIPNVRLTDQNNHVSNPDGLIATDDVRIINNVARKLEQEMGIELAVVAVKSIGQNEGRMFATELFNTWGLGKQGEDNGLLVLLITEPPERSIIFETGYGLEGVLPDAISYRLQQRYMIPDLRQGNYSEGLRKGVTALESYLLASDYTRAAMIEESIVQEEELPLSAFLLLFGLPMFVLFLARFLRMRPKICPNCGHRTYSYAGSEVVKRPTATQDGIVADVYRCSNCGYTNRINRRVNNAARNAALGAALGTILGGMGGRGGIGGGGMGGGSWGGGRSGGGGGRSRF